jgi:mannose-6-phosphate isomerase-like protein (cupin superfamily)
LTRLDLDLEFQAVSADNPGKDAEMEVKVVASRYRDRPKTDPAKRIFRIADHVGGSEQSRASRMYVGDDYRAVVITLEPGQAQEVHMHPATDHAWFIVSRTGEVTMEDGKHEQVEPGFFLVHPRNSVHGVRNTGADDFVYIAVSIGA